MRKQGTVSRLTAAERNEIAKRLAEMKSCRAIARHMGRASETINRVARTLRPRRGEQFSPLDLAIIQGRLPDYLHAIGKGKPERPALDNVPADFRLILKAEEARGFREVRVARRLGVKVREAGSKDPGAWEWEALLALLTETPEERWHEEPTREDWERWRARVASKNLPE